MTRVRTRPERLREAVALATVGGFLDAYTFLAHGGVFANAQTGNVILFGINAGQGDWPAAARRLAPLGAFAVGVLTVEALARARGVRLFRRPTRVVLLVEAATLVVVAALPPGVPTWLPVVLVAWAATLQVATFRTVRGASYNTTFTTGNLRSLFSDVAAWVADRDPAAAVRARALTGVVDAFVVGAVLGGLVTHALGNVAVLVVVPVLLLVLLSLAVDTRRLERRPLPPEAAVPTHPDLAGFRAIDVEVDGLRLHAVVGGDGPPVLLVHGYPQTHLMWHRVAPDLARDHTVVAPDLRGYGASSKPASTPDHATYSKRAMAADLVALMAHLGHERFDVVGHDRGARVTHRLALDYPRSVQRAAVLDIVPTSYVYDHVDRALAETYDHWFFLSGPAPLPEHLISLDPAAWIRTKLARWSAGGIEAFDPAVVEAYVDAFRDPACVAATTEDYRAGATVDLEHAAQGDDRRVTVPLLVLWGRDGFVGKRYEVLDVWRQFAGDVRGHAVPGGHFLPEEAPAETLAALRAFLS